MKRELLSEKKIRNILETELLGWEFKENSIHREVDFKDFLEAFAFMTRCALISEKLDHHPNWSNVYNKVKIQLSTHDAGGVTELDIEWAKRVTL